MVKSNQALRRIIKVIGVLSLGVVAGTMANLISAHIAYFKNYSIYVGISAFTVSVIVVLRYYTIKNICELYDKKNRICQLGIKRVRQKAEETIVPSLEEANSTFKWLGCSAVFVLCREDHTEIIRKKLNDGCNFTFLIRDLNAESTVSQFAKWAGLPLRRFKGHLEGTMEVLNDLKTTSDNIKFETSSNFPTFRIKLIDGKRCFISYYLPRKVGPEGFQIEILNTQTDKCIFRWFEHFFAASINESRKDKLNKAIIKKKFQNPTWNESEIAHALSSDGYDVTARIIDDTLKEYGLS